MGSTSALANWLAARALEDIPYDLINEHFIDAGTDRLARSFSRRLSFLHDHSRAVAIVDSWLAPDGLLGDVAALDDCGRAMFENVAPARPEKALTLLERAGDQDTYVAAMVWRRHLSLLRSLAYDPHLFERSAQMLARAATQSPDDREDNKASDTFVSLFTIRLSGTHATIEQRLGVIEGLLSSCEVKDQALGLAALDAVLEATHISSVHRFEFGGRSRDYGYQPKSQVDVSQWYGSALTLIERLAATDEVLRLELHDVVARNFRGQWTFAHVHDELEGLSRQFAEHGFWREGWAACRQTMYFDKDRFAPEAASRLSALETGLRPFSLQDRVRAFVLGDRSGGLDLEVLDVDDDPMSATERLEAIARRLGAEVVSREDAFAELLPELLRGGNKAWAFGRGLAAASPDPHAVWQRLIAGLGEVCREQQNIQVLRGFLAELWEQDKELAQQLLDAVLEQPALLAFTPVLHSAVKLDERRVERLKLTLRRGQVPIDAYGSLATGRTTGCLAGGILKDLVLLIADQTDGFHVALQILFMRLHSDRAAERTPEPELVEAGRELLQRVTFRKGNQRDNHELAGIVKICLTGPGDAPIAAELPMRFRNAAVDFPTYSVYDGGLVKALLEVQPMAVLNALFAGEEKDQQAVIGVFKSLTYHRGNPADAISCEALIAWCEGDGEHRYPLAASLITFARRPAASKPQIWSEQAKALLARAPDLRRVLTVFIDRLQPMTWSGSRAALMEANGRLLDSLESHVPSVPTRYVTEAKAQLAQEVRRERQCEREREEAWGQHFE